MHNLYVYTAGFVIPLTEQRFCFTMANVRSPFQYCSENSF